MAKSWTQVVGPESTLLEAPKKRVAKYSDHL